MEIALNMLALLVQHSWNDTHSGPTSIAGHSRNTKWKVH